MLVAVFAIAFIGGYLLNEPKAEAALYNNRITSVNHYEYDTFEVKGKTILVIKEANKANSYFTALVLD